MMAFSLTLLAVCCCLAALAARAEGADIYASYRKDYFYPYDEYREVNLPDPVDGGRFHLVSVSGASGKAGSVVLNGKPVSFEKGQDPDDWFVDWLHVYPPVLQQGAPVWISLHTRQKVFDKISSSTIELKTTDGATAVSGSFAVGINLCNITWVTCTKEFSSLLVHVHNGYKSSTRTVQKVLMNNTDVTANVSNKDSLTVPPLSSTLISFPLPSPTSPGSLYTLVLQFAEGGASDAAVAGGRITKHHFPVESWPKSHECPFPTVNDDNYKFHRDHGIDTLFFGQGAAGPCGKPQVTGSEIAGKLAPQNGFYCLLNTDIPLDSLKNSSMVLAILLGDEADVHLDDGIRSLMNETQNYWEQYSPFMTYVGGSRSRRSGIFSGVCDIQGMDMYVAACAPHIQEFLHPPPLRGSYDYLRLTRNNHMPLPTWTYSQLLDNAWDAKIGDKVLTHRQPNPDEARIQAMSVIAACAKGLMYFQSEIAENEYYPDTWKEIKHFNKDINAVRQYLYEGDCTDMVTSSDGDHFDTESLVQTIRSPEALILTVINLKNDGGYNDEECEIGINEHWKIDPHGVTQITVTVPTDFGKVVDSFEVQNGAILNTTSSSVHVVSAGSKKLGVDARGREIRAQQITVNNVKVDSELATRLFVFANTPEVRKQVQNNLQQHDKLDL